MLDFIHGIAGEDDGYLSASEIAALKIDAEWVILSACNSAAGQAQNAEAFSGLARAFIYAQAKAPRGNAKSLQSARIAMRRDNRMRVSSSRL